MRGSSLWLTAGVTVALRCTTGDTVAVGDIPPAPSTGVTTSETTSTFAIDHLFLGEISRSGGSPSTTAWTSFGYDLDRRTTNATTKDVCTLAAGAPTKNQVDGENGIDNAWGSLLLPILQVTLGVNTPSKTASDHLGTGDWTLQIQVTGFSNDIRQSALGLGAQVFVSGPSDGPPSFDSTTDWPVLPSSLNDAMTLASGARARFENVYVTNGTLVAEGAQEPIVLPIVYTGALCIVGCGPPFTFTLPLRVHHATLTFERADAGSATNGIIAGTLDAREVVEAFQAVAHRISVSMCGAAFDGIVQQLVQAQDILSDGTNAPGVACNAVSIGIGFTAKVIANPTKVGVDPTPMSDPCPADAGADAPVSD